MTDLTPQLLAQLESDVDVDNVDVRVEFLAHHCEELARIVDAVPALVAAAKERDQLRSRLEEEEADCLKIIDHRDALESRIAEIADALGDATEWTSCNDRGENALEIASEIMKERDQLCWKLDNTTALYTSHRNDAAAVAVALGLDGWEHGWPDVAPMIERLRAERDRAKQEIADIRGALDAHGHDGTFEAAGKLRDEAVKLRAEVERLRGLGLDATEILHAAIDGEPWAEQFEIKRGLLRAEIERKP